MNRDQVLIISFWNPTEKLPQQGIFIQEQAAAVCRMRENVIFLQVNILPSGNLFPRKTIEESEYYRNIRITLNLYTRLWKFWYVNPWIMARIVYGLIKKRGPKINPGIIHANVIYPCGLVAFLLAKRLKAQLLISEHWSKTGKLLKHPVYKRIAKRAYLKSYSVICVSEFLSDRIRKSTGHKNLEIIPNIIDTGVYRYLSKPPDDGIIRMLCAASWRLPKRLDLIFEAVCSYSAESQRNIELIVVGEGVQAEVYKNHKIPGNLNVKWPGYLVKTEIAELLHRTHFFLHASDIETFSLVTAEALSTGTPVLASNTGALPELINDENGLLADNTHEGWLNGIRVIVTKKFDYEAIALQNKGKYSWEKVGNSIISIYDRMNSALP